MKHINLSTDELVKRAGIPKGTFYLFYPSKEMLLFDCAQDFHEEVDEFVSKGMEQADGVEAVVDFVEQYLNVRSAPKVEKNNQVGILEKGTKVIVMSHKDPIESDGTSWVKVKFGNPEQEGYVMKKYIRIL